MATIAAQPTAISVDDYLAGEVGSELRHEYVGGQVYAMVGASDRHGLVLNALAFALTPAAREARCQLFTSDMKVRLQVGQQEVFYYPDLLLSCDPDDRATYYRERPCMIVEVLSESTERVDRREKMLAYLTLPSLQEYLLVAQDTCRVEVFRRTTAWAPSVHTEGAIPLQCLNDTVTVEAIYMDLERHAPRNGLP